VAHAHKFIIDVFKITVIDLATSLNHSNTQIFIARVGVQSVLSCCLVSGVVSHKMNLVAIVV
jgi:hypothetical protein